MRIWAATTVERMYRTLRPASSLAALAAATLLTSISFAHIDLQEPEPRAHGTGGGETPDTNSNQKAAPCGQSQNGRTTDRVSTYDPGETITVRLNEEINHTSYYRVWLNPNGDAFPARQPVQAQEDLAVALAADQALDQPGDADGRLLGVFADSSTVNNNEASFQVTLPADLECQNCTLQVIQFMYGSGAPYYHQCADLVIGSGGAVAGDAGAGGSGNAGAGGASLGGAGGAPATGAGGSSSLGAGGAPPVGAAGSPSAAGAPATGAGGGSATPATGAAGVGAPIVAGDDSDDEDSGCSVAPGTSASLLGVGSLVLFALSAMRRRSRRR
jgi:hypothetical protein